jgi:uncharacterized protein (TIGR03086 family)
METSAIAERFRRIGAAFTAVAEATPDGAWEQPAPCEGWVARDVVGHMVEWIPAFLSAAPAFHAAAGPLVADDPARAWSVLCDSIQSALDDPSVAASPFVHEMVGTHTFESAVDQFVTNDVFIHIWDLARAVGGNEVLDPAEVSSMLVAVEPYDEMLRTSGHYGPRVPVSDDASEQDRLIAFMGRVP